LVTAATTAVNDPSKKAADSRVVRVTPLAAQTP
jgi:hypothetical protein